MNSGNGKRIPGCVRSVRVAAWIKKNESYLVGPRGTMAEVAAKCASELDIDVSVTMLRDLMADQGFETKRVSKSEAERRELAGKNNKLKSQMRLTQTALGKLYASEAVSDDLKEFVFAGLDDEIRQALFGEDDDAE